MKPGAQIILSHAVRLYAPIAALFAFTLLAAYAPGAGIGFIAGLAFALALALHALAFGAQASRAAFPPSAVRLVLALGLIAALAGGGMPGWTLSGRVVEGGVFAATAAVAALALQTLFGRAPTLRDAEWQ